MKNELKDGADCAQSPTKHVTHSCLVARCNGLMAIDEGRITLDFFAAKTFACLGAAMACALGDGASVGKVMVANREFQLEIDWHHPRQDSFLGKQHIQWVERIREQCELLAQNAERASPKPAEELGVGTTDLKLLQALARLHSAEHPFLRSVDGTCIELPTPAPEHLAALPAKAPKPRYVSGTVTGVGIDEQGSTMIQIAGASMAIVSDLDLDEAIAHMKSRSKVAGKIVVVDGVEYLQELVLLDGQQSLFH